MCRSSLIMSSRTILQTLKKHPAVNKIPLFKEVNRSTTNVCLCYFVKVVPVFVITVAGAAFAGSAILRSANVYTDVS